MSYLAIYRRFRPNSFSEVVGQEHVVTTLVNQIKTERIGHAYLFCGARGTGKTTVARIFARAINCLNPQNGSPCGECEVCQKLTNPNSLDIIEIDAASNNKVDNVQEIRSNVQYPPVAGKYKVYIIDEVHMLTTEAFNALLKTLEEPPKHAVFVLATTEPHKLPATILSRCMRFDFHLVSDKVIENLIAKIYDEVGKGYEKEAISLIARSGEGSIRDALSLADLCISYSDEKLTYKQVIDVLGASDSSKTASLLRGILNSDTGTVLSIIEELTSLGKSVSVLSKDVLSMVRDVLVIKTCKGAKEVLSIPTAEYEALKAISELAENHRFLRILEIFTAIETDLRYSTHPRIVFESAAIKASMPAEDYNIDALIARISALEKTVEDLMKNGVKMTSKVEPVSVETLRVVSKVESSDVDAENAEKPVYKPENEEKQIVKEFKNEPKAESAKDLVKEKRLSGFDYISDEDVPPPIESCPPIDDQISFYGFEEAVKPSNNNFANGSLPNIEKTQPTPTTTTMEKTSSQGVIRDRVSDARLWGTVIRKLRSEKHIMLWIACQELDAKIADDTLTILAEGENEYNLLIKKESIDTLQSIVSNLAPYKVKVKRVGVEDTSSDDFIKDAEKVKDMFDGKIEIKD